MDYTHRIAFHQRAQRDVLAKIKKVYPLDAGAWELPLGIADEVNARFKRHLHEGHMATQWNHTKQMAEEHSGVMPGSLTKALDQIAGTMAPRFTQAFYIHRRIDDNYGSDVLEIYQDPYENDTLGYIYKNHLCNELQAHLQKAGLDEKSAYLVLSQIIRYSIVASRETIPSLFTLSVKPSRGLSDETAHVQQEVRGMRRYWQEERDNFQSKQRSSDAFSR